MLSKGGVLKAMILPHRQQRKQHNEHLAMINDTASVSLVAQAGSAAPVSAGDGGNAGAGGASRRIGWIARVPSHSRKRRF